MVVSYTIIVLNKNVVELENGCIGINKLVSFGKGKMGSISNKVICFVLPVLCCIAYNILVIMEILNFTPLYQLVYMIPIVYIIMYNIINNLYNCISNKCKRKGTGDKVIMLTRV